MRLVLASILLLSNTIIFAQDLETRLAHHSFAKADLDEVGFSVLIETSSLHETNRPISDDDTEEDLQQSEELGAAKGMIREHHAERLLTRLIVGKRGQWQRVDGTQYSLLGEDIHLNHTTHYAELVHEIEGWFYKNHRLRSGAGLRPAITRFRIAGGVSPGFSVVTRRHPFDISFAQAAGIRSVHKVETATYDHKVINESALPDGRTEIWTFISEGSVFRFVFNKEETWCNEEVEFWTNDELYKSYPSPIVSELKMETVKAKYRRYASNHTKWIKIGDHIVPISTIVRSQTRFRNQEFEIRYMDWKFGDDADLTLLEEEKFNVEAISKSIDFIKLKDKFDKLEPE